MDFFEGLLSQIVPKVGAQAADTTAQPTFGLITTTPNTSQLSKVELNAATPTQALGQNFKVDIVVNTGTILIREYQIVLEFDSNRLSVVDAYPNEEGNQIEFLDDTFDVISNGNRVEIDTVTGKGKITLTANNPSGTAITINRTVGRITFQPQALGTTELTHVEGLAGTVLYNQAGVALSSTRNNLTLVVQQSSGTTTATTTNTATTTTPASSSTTSTTPSIPVDQIPDTGLFDGNNLPFILGVLLVMLGISLNSERKKAKTNKRTK